MFDDIRPYTDAEIPAAMHRIAEDPYFVPVCSFLFPGEDIRKTADILRSCQSVYDFQTKFMYPAVTSIIKNTTGGVTIDGLEHLSADKSYLFISNHRDIVLDAAILQILLADADLPTSEITFGANLMTSQFIVDIGKSNKMFRVERPTTVASGRELLQKSAYLSGYIRHTIKNKHESIWIAQRNGRTKDGNDLTDRGIITMLCQSGTDNRVESLAELNIVPLSISYEWEPCDILKSLEMSKRSAYEPYIKRPGEDLQSILTGITQQKGRIHFSVGRCITTDDLSGLSGLSKGDFTRAVANMIDRWIQSSYMLFPNNYIAYDILNDQVSDNYTEVERQSFLKHLSLLEKYPDFEATRQILLKIYATPLINRANCIYNL